MGLFFGRKNFAERHEEALLNYDCERSVGIILDFIQKMETLQETLRRGKRKQGVMAAQICCENPIISCSSEELPTVGLKMVQGVICDVIVELEPESSSDIVQGLYNIAADGKCPEVIAVCKEAISRLRAAKGRRV